LCLALQVRDLKKAHSNQLDLIEMRVQGVLKKKDARIQELCEELAVLHRGIVQIGGC
jgi:hypothetical protein